MARLLLLSTLLVAAFASLAQEPEFFIERIEVRGTRFTSANVIRRQTLLTEGRTYTEPQLKAAIDRVNRLPFVIDAELALEKGSERERYVLAIRVVETKPLFLDAESRKMKFDTQSPQTWHELNRVEAGVRGFLGSTLLHASTNFEGVYSAGVTQYNLFGSSAYASANVRWTDRRQFLTLQRYPTPDPGEYEEVQAVSKVEPSVELVLGAPIRGNHSIHASWVRNAQRLDTTTSGETTRNEMKTEYGTVAWIYDSTDDALFPTRGTYGRAGLYLVEATSFVFAGPNTMNAEFRQQTAFVEARRYWDFGPHSVNAGATVARTRTPFPDFIDQSPQYNNSYGAVAGYSASLWPRRQTVRFGDLRFETKGTYTKYDGFYAPDSYNVQAGLAFRNPWALLRFTMEYVGSADL